MECFSLGWEPEACSSIFRSIGGRPPSRFCIPLRSGSSLSDCGTARSTRLCWRFRRVTCMDRVPGLDIGRRPIRGDCLEMTRVVYWNNIPSPYMVDRFNAVAARANMDFEAWFSARTEDDRSWSVNEESWNFRWRYLPKVKVGGHSLAFAPELLGGAAPDLLVGLHADPGFLVSHYIGRARGTRIVLWVTPTYDAWIRRRRWKEAVKHVVFSHADAIFTTGSDGRRIARAIWI